MRFGLLLVLLFPLFGCAQAHQSATQAGNNTIQAAINDAAQDISNSMTDADSE